MDPVTLALILKAAQEGATGAATGISNIGASAAQIDRLSPEERNRIKELERQQALGLLGMDAAQEQAILNQNLQPVQSLQRELLRQQQQQQAIGDIGQGAAFRQQQAQQQGLQQATSAAQQQAQDQILQLDRLAAAEQRAELARLKQQRRRNIQGGFGIAGGVLQTAGAAAGAAGQGAATKAFLDEGGAIEALLDPTAYAKEVAKAQTSIVEKASEQKVEPDIAQEFFQALQSQNPNATTALQEQAFLTNLGVGEPSTVTDTDLTSMMNKVFLMPGASFGYKVASVDVNGNPTSFQFVKSDGTVLEQRFDSSTPQYREALNAMALQELGER